MAAVIMLGNGLVPALSQPRVGVLRRRFFAFVEPVTSYSLGPGQWSWGQVAYPFTYHPNTGRGLCHGKMTLRWRGVFEGWVMGGGSSYCEVRGHAYSFYGVAGN